jgi:hypothetical protein
MLAILLFCCEPIGLQFRKSETQKMLWTVCVVLIVLWLLGVVTSYTLGGFIHLLLVLAIAAMLIRIIRGQSPI